MMPNDIRATKGMEGMGFPIRSCTPHLANNPEVAFLERGGGGGGKPVPDEGNGPGMTGPPPPAPTDTWVASEAIGGWEKGLSEGHTRGSGKKLRHRDGATAGGEPTAAPEIVKDAGRAGSWPHGGGESLPSQTG
ncbi:hypothetical protein QJS10_CPB13g01099 [Acorus calamus]|uniref:Uncharacterized protein n=1 Tax=Acorus calamus TaxID=4465 RepID=A0AAV9DFX1_ACOCL|nr:hypothetical protein QJS10_CPB13g01099 [Acorus calamus]